MAEKPKHFDCPKCGKRYYEPQRFCVECGLDFRAAFRVCPKCKADTPSESEKCVNCDYNLEDHDMRRPRYIAGLIVLGVIVLAFLIPYWWGHTSIGKMHGEIIQGEVFFVYDERIEFIPMFYEWESAQKEMRRMKGGEGPRGFGTGAEMSGLVPLPAPITPYENVSIGEEVFVTKKTRDMDGEMWYHIRRYRKDVVRHGWVHESNIEFK
jgi:hypothetical protein